MCAGVTSSPAPAQAARPRASTWAPSPTGWLEAVTDVDIDGNVHLQVVSVVAATGARTMLAEMANPADPSGWLWSIGETCDTSGYAMLVYSEDEAAATATTQLMRGTFTGSGATLMTSRTDDLGVYSLSVLGISGRTIAYTRTTDTASTLYRITDPNTPTTVATVAGDVLAAAVSGAATAYVTRGWDAAATTSFYVRPVGGSAAAVGGMPQVGDVGLWPYGSLWALGVMGSGQYLVGSSMTQVWQPPTAPLRSAGVSMSAGRATWSDDRNAAGVETGWSRAVTGSGVLTLGSESLIQAHMSGSAIVSDGRRTAWNDRATGRLGVHDGTGPTVTGVAMSEPVTAMSAPPGDHLGRPDRRPGDGDGGRRGERLGHLGQQRHRDRRPGQPRAHRARHPCRDDPPHAGHAGVPDGGTFGAVAVQGDLVAWTWGIDTDNGANSGVGWLELGSGEMGGWTDPDFTYAGTVSVYGSYVGFDRYVARTDSTYYTVLDAATGARSATSPASSTRCSATWASARTDQISGEPKVTPLPDQDLAPRHRGQPHRPHLLRRHRRLAHLGGRVGVHRTTDRVRGRHQGRRRLSGPGPPLRHRVCRCRRGRRHLGRHRLARRRRADRQLHLAGRGRDADGPAVDLNGTSTTISGPLAVAGTFTGTAYQPLTPSRLLDSRVGTGVTKGLVKAHATVQLQVTGRGGVPATGVTAVVLNVTVTGATGAGYVTAYFQTGVARPAASNLNYAAGQTIANQVVAKVGTGGKVSLYTDGSTHLIADVAGSSRPGRPTPR